MMKVTIDNTTGYLIDSQSHGDDMAMLMNAADAGFSDVSVREVTDAEHDALVKARDDSRKTYVQLRAEEYAKKPIAEQLDMMYWDKVNGTTHHQDWVAGIKAMHPKQ